jgi:hypothetical protein
MLDGMSWVRKLAVSCSAGSMKEVLAAPSQASSPALDRTLLATGSSMTANARPPLWSKSC